jgi:hypothetical protein
MNLGLLRRRFPQLGEIELAFWMGWLAVSQNHAPAFGPIGDNAYAASCCNGSGIVRHTAAGMLIADGAGRENPLIDDFLVEGTANYIPPRPVLTSAWASRWRGTCGVAAPSNNDFLKPPGRAAPSLHFHHPSCTLPLPPGISSASSRTATSS